MTAWIDKYSINLLPYITICGQEITLGWICFCLSIHWGENEGQNGLIKSLPLKKWKNSLTWQQNFHQNQIALKTPKAMIT